MGDFIATTFSWREDRYMVDRKGCLLHAESVCTKKNGIYRLTIAGSTTPVQEA